MITSTSILSTERLYHYCKIFTAYLIMFLLIPVSGNSQCSPNCIGGNTYLGQNVAPNNTGNGNTFIGYFAANSNTSGVANTFMGNGTGSLNTSGGFNSFFASNAGRDNTTGKSNTALGFGAGLSNTDGSSNLFIGFNSGSKVLSGDNNIFIGSKSGPTTISTVNNRLFIDVKASNEPLIYGEFDNDFLKINGSFEVTAGLSNPSSRSIKFDFEQLDPTDVLEKIASLDIKKWRYHLHPDVQHVGPVSEDFYEAFGLGANDKQISTIDADGVLMLAIQALQNENELLKRELEQQRAMIEELRIK